MSEANKALVSKWYDELFNQGNLDVADEIIALNNTQQGEFFSNLPSGPQGHKQLVTLYKDAFPDAKIKIDNVSVAEGGNVVTVEWTAKGSHQGTFKNHPASGKKVTIKGLDTWHIQDGKIVQHECDCDMEGLLGQLGPAAPSG